MVLQDPLDQLRRTKSWTAICKSQLEAIIKKPGNTRGVGTSFWSLIRRRTIPGFSFVCNAGYPSEFQKLIVWTVGSLSKLNCHNDLATIKPWSNGLASRRKLKTWAYLRLRLARTCVHLRWLAMTCAHFGRDQICTQVKASLSPFGHPAQVNASWVTPINLLLANEIEDSLP